MNFFPRKAPMSPQPKSKTPSFMTILIALSFVLGIGVCLFIGVLVFVAKPVVVTGHSMEPNYKNGQYYIVNKLVYGFRNPQRGDVVVYHSPDHADATFIGRIVGLSGEQISILGGNVLINGKKLDERAYSVGDGITNPGTFFKDSRSLAIPDHAYVILGDNRPKSADSRSWGFVTNDLIVGKITLCYAHCKE